MIMDMNWDIYIYIIDWKDKENILNQNGDFILISENKNNFFKDPKKRNLEKKAEKAIRR